MKKSKNGELATAEDLESNLKRNGIDNSLYLSKDADTLLTSIKKKTRRSRSMIASLIIEKHGPAVEKDPKSLL